MKLSEMKAKMHDELNKRIQESYDNRQATGKFKSIFNEEMQIPIWKIGVGEHLIDIIPYMIGEGNPNPKRKLGEIGDYLNLFVHNGVGVNENQYICLARCYSKPCPVCELRLKLQKEGEDPDSLKSFNPTRRCVYNVIVYDDGKEEAKGVQVMIVAYYFMQRHLDELANPVRPGSSRTNYMAYNKTGKSIAFKREGAGAKNTSFVGHKFEDRNYDIPDEILDSTFCLEKIIHIPSYSEVYEALHGKVEESKTDGPPLVAESQRSTETNRAGIGRVRGGVVSTVDETKKSEPQSDDHSCPDSQGEIGTSIDKLNACQTCTVYETCFALNEEIEKLEREKRRASIGRRGTRA